MSEVSPLDERGRFTVDPKFRKFLGRRVIQVLTPDGILLVPVKGKLPRGTLPASLSIDGDAAYREERSSTGDGG